MYRIGAHRRLAIFLLQNTEAKYPIEEVPYPKAPRRLPIILTPEEVIRLLDSARNLLHRALLMTAYRRDSAVRKAVN